MTYEDAIAWLKFRKNYAGELNHEYDDSVTALAIKALEKLIPLTPTHEATLYRSCTCPKCKNVIDDFTDFAGERVRVTADWCKYCGQAIDWSDLDDK